MHHEPIAVRLSKFCNLYGITMAVALSCSVQSTSAADVTSTWSSATSGNWDVNANWTNVPAGGGFPNNGNGGVATYDAVINAAGSPYTVTLGTSITLEDLTLNSVNATVSQTAGTLTTSGAINVNSGTYSLAGGTIAGSTVNATVPIGFSGLGNGVLAGTLNGVAVSGDLNFPDTFSDGLITGGTTFTTAHLSGIHAEIGFAPSQTLTGTIQFEGANAGLRLVTMSSAGAFTVGATGVIKTVAGLTTSDPTIGGGGFLYNGAMALTNNGLISSQTSGRTITVKPDTLTNSATGTLEAKSGGILTIAPTAAWSNAGTISVNAGTVNLGGTFNATGGIGTWSNTGGTVNVTGTVNVGSGANTLTLNNATGSWNMAGGALSGGTLAFANSKTLNFTGLGNGVLSGTLNGVTVSGDLNFADTFSDGLITGGTTFTTAHLSGIHAEIGFAPSQTLTGTIQFEGANAGLRLVTMSSAGAFTVGTTGVITTVAGLTTSDPTIGGGGFLYNGAMALTNNGLISSQTSGRTITVKPDTLTNSATGTLEAKSGGILTIAPTSTWANAGTISVNAATVNLGGTFNATGGIGTWSNTGGTVNVTGTITNTAHTLTLDNTTGSWNMAGGTLNGGTLAFANSKTLNFSGLGQGVLSGTLNGVTVSGDLNFADTFSDGLITGGTTFTTAHLSGIHAEIGFAPSQTLTGTIQFEGANAGLRLVTMSSAGAFTVGTTGVITTVAGLATSDPTIGGGGFLYNGAMALTNNGLISSQTSGRTITVNPATSFANGGTLEAINGGSLSVPLGYTQTAGITRLNGGGAISAIDPVMITTLHSITIAGGRLEGSGTISANVANSGTISPGLSAGALSIAGDLTLTGSSTLQMELGGTRPGVDYDTISEAGTLPLNLSGTLSLTLINGYVPAPADTLIIAMSNQPITGAFSNVAGGHVLATDGVTSLGVLVIGNVVVVAKLPGDYNGNGKVDAADYTVWRNKLGSGAFTRAHFDIWKANYGATSLGSGAAESAAVPEPASVGLFAFAWAAGVLKRSRRRK